MNKQQLFENIKRKRPYIRLQQGYNRRYSSILYRLQTKPGFL